MSVSHMMRWEWWSALRRQESKTLSLLVRKLIRTKGHQIKRMALFSIPAGLFYGLTEEYRLIIVRSKFIETVEQEQDHHDKGEDFGVAHKHEGLL
jgi:hypothetical protein